MNGITVIERYRLDRQPPRATGIRRVTSGPGAQASSASTISATPSTSGPIIGDQDDPAGTPGDPDRRTEDTTSPFVWHRSAEETVAKVSGEAESPSLPPPNPRRTTNERSAGDALMWRAADGR